MKTITDVRQWHLRVQMMFHLLHEADQRLAECELREEQADRMDVKRHVAKWHTEMEYAQAQLDTGLKQLLQLTGRRDRQEAYELLVDIGVRLDQVQELYEDWRRTLAARDRLAYTQIQEPETLQVDPDAIMALENACRVSELLYNRGVHLLLNAVPTAVRMG